MGWPHLSLSGETLPVPICSLARAITLLLNCLAAFMSHELEDALLIESVDQLHQRLSGQYRAGRIAGGCSPQQRH